MDREVILAALLHEMRRGTLVMCVLAKLRRSTYGYNLIAQLAGTGISIEANTLYPLLRRLEDQNLLASAWNTTDGANPRKYYITTAFGEEILTELCGHWQKTVDGMKNILEEKR